MKSNLSHPRRESASKRHWRVQRRRDGDKSPAVDARGSALKILEILSIFRLNERQKTSTYLLGFMLKVIVRIINCTCPTAKYWDSRVYGLVHHDREKLPAQEFLIASSRVPMKKTG